MKTTMLRAIPSAAVLAWAALSAPASWALTEHGTFPIEIGIPAANCPLISSDITGAGNGHFLVHMGSSGRGVQHMIVEFNARGRGTDASGSRWVLSDVAVFSVNGIPEGAPAEFTATENFHLIQRGGGTRIRVHGILHVRLDAAGDVTVFVDKVRGEEGRGCEPD